MTEENQTDQPKWVTELKEWGIDVEAFDARWEQAGADAKAQFQQALANAEAEYESANSAVDAKIGEVREDLHAFVQKMDAAWDNMVNHIMQELQPEAKDDDKS